MPENTPGGWPYILPADHPKEYPAHSQQFALQMDLSTVAVPVNTGGSWTGTASASRQGKIVIFTLTANKGGWATGETMATVPAGYRPVTGTLYFVVATVTAGTPAPFSVNSAGVVATVTNVATGGGMLGTVSWVTA